MQAPQRILGPLAAVLVLACSSADRRDADAGAGKVGSSHVDGGLDAGAVAWGELSGRVVKVGGGAVGGAKVVVDGQLLTTDNRGLFHLSGPAKQDAQVVVVDEWFTAAQKKVPIVGDAHTQVTLEVLDLIQVELPSAEDGGVIEHDLVHALLPAGSLQKASGESVTGTVMVHVLALDDPSMFAAAPGMKGLDDDDEPVDLTGYGMLDMRFYQDGELLEFSGEAELEFPLGPNDLEDGSEIDVWAFVQREGAWKREGRGRVDRARGTHGVAHIKATHFSWWGALTTSTASSCLTGRLESVEGAPVAGVTVNVTGDAQLAPGYVTTAADGSFCIATEAGTEHRVRAHAAVDGIYQRWETTAPGGTGAATCSSDDCVDLGVIAGEALFTLECEMDLSQDQGHVLLLSSGDEALDDRIALLLSRYDVRVSVGPALTDFDGTLDLSEYDAVYLQPSDADGSDDMPEAGQRQLVDWVNCGGGLLTVEPAVQRMMDGGFRWLREVLPAEPAIASAWEPEATYAQVGEDETIHAGLPERFTFGTDSSDGSQIRLVARPGATTFYASEAGPAGVVGWEFHLGRVVNVGSTADPVSLADAHFSRMLANAVKWLQRDEATDPVDLVANIRSLSK